MRRRNETFCCELVNRRETTNLVGLEAPAQLEVGEGVKENPSIVIASRIQSGVAIHKKSIHVMFGLNRKILVEQKNFTAAGCA